MLVGTTVVNANSYDECNAYWYGDSMDIVTSEASSVAEYSNDDNGRSEATIISEEAAGWWT